MKTPTDRIKLLVGLNNPGSEYSNTRHNAGEWLVNEVARKSNCEFKTDKKFFGRIASGHHPTGSYHLLLPDTFMNKSGQSVAAVCQFYKIKPQEVLVVHDELDLEPGIAKFKFDGGHGGHNGLRDIIKSLGNNKGFHRLRIGIGHPGQASKVVGYVLKKPSLDDKIRIERSIDEAVKHLDDALKGDWATAMNKLHAFSAK